jgi:hypothetical protein
MNIKKLFLSLYLIPLTTTSYGNAEASAWNGIYNFCAGVATTTKAAANYLVEVGKGKEAKEIISKVLDGKNAVMALGYRR